VNVGEHFEHWLKDALGDGAFETRVPILGESVLDAPFELIGERYCNRERIASGFVESAIQPEQAKGKETTAGMEPACNAFPPADKNASSARNGRTLPLGASQESGLTPQSKPIKCRTVLKSGLESTWEFMPPRPGSAMILRATTGCICQVRRE
jgi:hypothetical protein